MGQKLHSAKDRLLSQMKEMGTAEKKGETKVAQTGPVVYENLFLEGFTILHLEEMRVGHKVNGHACMEFTATITEEEAEKATTETGEREIGLYYLAGGEKVPTYFFRGSLSDYSVGTVRGMKILQGKAYSHTHQLDTERREHSYQDRGQTYKEIIGEVLKRTKKAWAGVPGTLDRKTGRFYLQYKESDWGFIKRLASHSREKLYGDMTSPTPYFTIGVGGKGEKKEIEGELCSIEKDITAYQKYSKNGGQGCYEEDFVLRRIKSTGLSQVGDCVQYGGMEYYIQELEYRMEGGMVTAYYILCHKNGLTQRILYLDYIQGMSLKGTVSLTERDRVYINLFVDGGEGGEYAFPYSTVAASEDGSGWYFMPEKGDQVRLYFPSKDERDCYVVGSVALTSEGLMGTGWATRPSNISVP